MPNASPEPRAQFTSSVAAFLTMAGAAIGLGNIWRFPYMMGEYGGSAFFLIYLVFIVLIATPALAGEWALGRHTGGGTITALASALGARFGRSLGYVFTLAMLFSASYYLVIIGNVGYMSWISISTGFGGPQRALFLEGLGNASLQYPISLLVLSLILVVTFKGLKQGIERVSKLFVPIFFVVILYLIYVTLRLDNAIVHMKTFVQPDFSQINSVSVFAALGQAVFSVGLGGTIMVVYGSYLQREIPLLRAAAATAFTDTSAALLASLFIFPTILVYGISPSAGPTLLFESMSQLFAQMDSGRLIGSFFLLALLLVAFLSGVAALEVVIASISDDSDKNKLGRGKTICIFGAVEAVLMLLPALKPQSIAILDLLFGSGMLALGSLSAIVGLSWFLGKGALITEFGDGRLANILFIWLRWVVPGVILTVLVASIIP